MWEAYYGLSLVVGEHMRGHGLEAVAILAEGGLGAYDHVLDLDHMTYKLRYVVVLAQHDDDLHGAVVDHGLQQVVELGACLGVKTNEGVVDDEHLGGGKDGRGEHELAQLAAGEHYDIFVEHGLEVEQLVDVFLEELALGRVVAGEPVGLVELLACGHGSLVNLGLVPALLKEVGAVVVASIGVAERDIFDVVRDELLVCWREVILGVVAQQRMAADKYVDKHRLASSVRAHDGQVLTLEQLKIDGLSHSPCRHACHAVLNVNHFLHSLS